MPFPDYIQYNLKVKVDPDLPLEQVQEIVISQLEDLPFESFEQGEDNVLAYIQSSQNNADIEMEIANLHLVDSFTTVTIKGENWNKIWEENFEPLKIAKAIHIRAPFHPVDKNITYDIIIEPKMSFGTGHHSTTQLMMEEMLRLNFQDQAVLDMGCGTSILAILAEKLGSQKIIASDNDPQCIENSLENIEANQCKHIEVYGIEKIPANFKVDIILANIQKNVLTEQMPFYSGHITPNGHLLMSGIYEESAEELCAVATDQGFTLHNQAVLNDWCMLHMVKNSQG